MSVTPRLLLVRLLACAAFALAAAPAAAGADDEPPPVPVPAAEPLMASAHALAVARWGIDPCGGQVTTIWSHMGQGINARSQWMSTDSGDPSTFSQCSITYNLDVEWDWPKLCTVVEHELGHLAGHAHVDDPHDVMSAYYVFPTPECAGAATGAAPSTPSRGRASQAVSSQRVTSKRKRRVKGRAARMKHAQQARARAKSAKPRAKSARARSKSRR